jgi:hypothetical protein
LLNPQPVRLLFEAVNAESAKIDVHPEKKKKKKKSRM